MISLLWTKYEEKNDLQIIVVTQAQIQIKAFTIHPFIYLFREVRKSFGDLYKGKICCSEVNANSLIYSFAVNFFEWTGENDTNTLRFRKRRKKSPW